MSTGYPLFPSACATRSYRAVLCALLLISSATFCSAQSSNVTLLGQLFTGDGGYKDIWGYNAPDGSEIAILGTSAGIDFIDATNPYEPVLIEHVPLTQSSHRDMKTYGHYVYEVNETGGGLTIIDLEDPTNPEVVISLTRDFSEAHNVYIDIEAGVLYAVGAPNGTLIYDLTIDPEQPSLTATFNEFYIHDIFVRDGFAYAGAINSRSMSILDVSNLPEVRVVSRNTYPGAVTHNTWLTDDGNFCLSTDETGGGHIHIFDVSDPAEVRHIAEWKNPESPNSSVHNVTVQGPYAFISWYTEGLQILDVRNPVNPVRVGYYDTYPGSGLFRGAWGVYPFLDSGNILVSDISDGLYVFRFDGQTVRYTGSVLDRTSGHPVVGATVRVPDLYLDTETDSEGRFELHVPQGGHVLVVERFGYGATQRRIKGVAGEPQEIEIELRAFPSGSVSGTVVASNGDAIADVPIQLLATPLSTQTDAGGAFTIPAIPVGSYEIMASRFGFQGERLAIDVERDQSLVIEIQGFPSVFSDDFELDRGWIVGSPTDEATSGIWERGDPHGTDSGGVQPEDDHTHDGVAAFVTGNLAPEDGEPLDIGADDVDGGATTLTSPVLDLSGTDRPVLRYYRWYSNSAGANSGDDEFVVDVTSDGGATWINLETLLETKNQWGLVEASLAELITVTSTVQIRFVASDHRGPSAIEAALDDVEIFDKRLRVAGEVFDSQSGLALAGADVQIEGTKSRVTSDSDGRFSLPARQGIYQIGATAFGYHETGMEVSVSNDVSRFVSLALEPKPTGSVEGTITSGSMPVVGADVHLLESPLSTKSDERGTFSFEGVPIGEYGLQVDHESFHGLVQQVEILATDTRRLSLELLRTLELGLNPAIPNPFRESTILRFSIDGDQEVVLAIYDAAGREVRRLLDGKTVSGEHAIEWNGKDQGGRALPQGVYFQRLERAGTSETDRIIILR